MITQERALEMARGRRMFISLPDEQRLTELLNQVYMDALEAAAKVCDSEAQTLDVQINRGQFKETMSVMTSEKMWSAKSMAINLSAKIRGMK